MDNATPERLRQGVWDDREQLPTADHRQGDVRERHRDTRGQASGWEGGDERRTTPPSESASSNWRHEHDFQMKRTREALLRVSEKLKAILDWKLAFKDEYSYLKRKVDIIYQERERLEQELIEQITTQHKDGFKKREPERIEPIKVPS